MKLSFTKKADAVKAGLELKAKYIGTYKNIIVWLEKESGQFVVCHNLTGSISNHMNKIQHVL